VTLQKDLWPTAAEVRANRRIENPFVAPLAARFRHTHWVKSAVVWEALGIPIERQPNARTNVGKAMRDLGFTRKQCRSKCEQGERGDWFYSKDPDED
jgi:hypothetical protein